MSTPHLRTRSFFLCFAMVRGKFGWTAALLQRMMALPSFCAFQDYLHLCSVTSISAVTQGWQTWSVATSGPLLVFANKFHWNVDIFILLYVVCGCFRATAAQLNSCSRTWATHKD